MSSSLQSSLEKDLENELSTLPIPILNKSIDKKRRKEQRKKRQTLLEKTIKVPQRIQDSSDAIVDDCEGFVRYPSRTYKYEHVKFSNETNDAFFGRVSLFGIRSAMTKQALDDLGKVMAEKSDKVLRALSAPTRAQLVEVYGYTNLEEVEVLSAKLLDPSDKLYKSEKSKGVDKDDHACVTKFLLKYRCIKDGSEVEDIFIIEGGWGSPLITRFSRQRNLTLSFL